MSHEKGLTVAVTGAAGYLAGRLIEALDADPAVGRILGFDVVTPKVRAQKLVHDPMDIRDPAIGSRLSGVDVLVHLAFIMDPIKDEAHMRDVNVNGSHNVFISAAKAGVPRVVYTSSATVYGAHPNNDVPLTEDSPLRANLDFSYPAHKLEVEYVIRELREEFPQTSFTVFRPVTVFGPHVDNAWSHLLESPVLLRVKGYEPPFQFVHEEDVALALRFAVMNPIEGTFNLAPEDRLSSEEIVELVDKRVLEIPEPTAFAFQSKMWTLGLGEAPPGMLHYVLHPWVVSAEKLSEAGFTCRYSSREALEATLARTAHRVRFGTASVSRGALRTGALASAGAVSGLVLLRGVRRKHKKASLLG